MPITAAYFLLYLIFLQYILLYPRFRIPRTPIPQMQMVMLVVFLAWGGVTAVDGVAPENSIRKLFNTLNFALVFVAVVQIVRRAHDVRLIAKALIASGVILSTLGIAQFSGSHLLGGGFQGALVIAEINRSILVLTEGTAVVDRVPDWSQWWRYNNWYSTAFDSLRATGTAWSPMSFAQMIFISFFPLVTLVLTIVEAAALIATLSRGAWIGTAVGIMVIILYFVRGRMRVKKALFSRLLLISCAGILVFLIIVPKEQLSTAIIAIVSSFQAEVDVSQFDSSNSARFGTYQTGFDLFIANPVTGVGPGNYSIASNSGEGATSHNLYLDIAAEMGLLGLLLFASILLMSLSNLAYASRKSQDGDMRALSVGWIATIIALMFYWMFTSYFFEPKLNMLLWLLMGLSVALREIATREHKYQGGYLP
jgi:O-antigen ligase